MKSILTILTIWGGPCILLLLCILGIILSLSGASSKQERQSNGQDDAHYVLRQPLRRIIRPIMILLIGAAVQAVLTFTSRFFPENYHWLPLVLKLAAAVLFGLLFWIELAKVIRQRVFVSGESIFVTPAVGATMETTFSQIRTVANKVVGGAGGIVGKKIKTKEGKRFEVINTMEGYETFCEQLDAKVELPNLTKKLFKGKEKEVPEQHEEQSAESFVQPTVDPEVNLETTVEGQEAMPQAHQSASMGPDGVTTTAQEEHL